MRKRAWIVPAVIACGGLVAFRMSGCLNSKAPDEKLAGRFDDLCAIADDNIQSPQRGVQKLGRYLGSHTGDMLGDLGETIQIIEHIDNDEAHDARARLARRRIAKSFEECDQTWRMFFTAVNHDPVAKEMLERGLDRVGRTLEIIFGDDQLIDFRHLPIDLISRDRSGS
jgi:hypothetical protein